MASIKLEPGVVSTVLTTQLNSLTDGSRAITSDIDNSSDLYLVDDVELHLEDPAATYDTEAVVHLYLIRSRLSGTGYEDGGTSVVPPFPNHVGTFVLNSAGTTQNIVLRQIPIPPSAFKYLLVNDSGVTFASSGNTLKRTPYRYQL